MSSLRFVAFGAVFGFLLSRARATSPEAITGMFLLTDLHLFVVIGAAIATAAVGIALLKRAGRGACFRPKAPTRHGFLGGAVFGVGWALAAACPGTALAQLGEGRVLALATIVGILAGTWLQSRLGARRHAAAGGA